jgi:outer membrane receptor protein involved in Fe transport
LAAISIPTAIHAQSAPTTFRIPAGELDQALRIYARTVGRQILFKPQDVRGKRFAGLQATLDPDAALDAILQGSGLTTARPSPNVIVVRYPTSMDPAGSVSVTGEEDDAQVIVVTGTNLRGGSVTGPVRTINRRDFERSGKATIADAIAAQTANFGGSGNPVASLTGLDQSSLNFSLAPAANLRGLGTDATLTLFDGRRVAGSGGRGDFVDLSAIPSLAVDRVEILTDGASAIYGSDAIAGVVNIILRRRFDGVEARVRGSLGMRGEPRGAIGSAVAGRTWSTGSIMAAYEYEHRGRLSSSDRTFTATGDLRPFGGSDRRTFYASPGNILSFSPSAGTFVPTFAIPTLNRQPTVGDIQPGENRGNLFALSDLSPRIDRQAGYARINQTIGERLDLFADARLSHRTFDYFSPPPATVFVATPANPFFLPVAGEPFSLIAYSFLNDLGPSKVNGRVSALSLTGGFTARLPGDWTVDGYASFARERSSDIAFNQINATALDEALGNLPDDPLTTFSTARDGFFNPYGSGASNSSTILSFVGSGYSRLTRRSTLTEGAMKADGSLMTGPGGAIRLAIGGSYRRETFRNSNESFYTGTTPTRAAGIDGSRNIEAGFAEVQVPVVGPTNARPGIRSFLLSAAIRHERYGDFGTTTNPKLGFAYSPAVGMTIRASYGTSFRAPALPEVNNPGRVIATALPDATGTTLPVLLVTGGNPALGPERAETWSGGMVIAPPAVPGLKWEVNLFTTRFDERIAQPALEDFARALSNPALAAFVRRIDPANNAGDLAEVSELLARPGAITGSTPANGFGAIVEGRFVNTAALDVSGLDWDVRYTTDVGTGRLETGLSATWLFHYRQRLTALSPSIDRLDTLGNPVNLKLRGSATWTQGPFAATLIGNYVDSYRDDVSSPSRRISSFVTADATLGYAPVRGLLAGLRLALAIENLFDADPPFVDRVNGLGFDAGNASPIGRVIALELRRSW